MSKPVPMRCSSGSGPGGSHEQSAAAGNRAGPINGRSGVVAPEDRESHPIGSKAASDNICCHHEKVRETEAWAALATNATARWYVQTR